MADDAVKKDLAEAERRQGVGVALLGRGRWEEAEGEFRGVLGIVPGSGEAMRGLGRALMGGRKFGEAVGVLREVVAKWPEVAGAWCDLGNALVKLRRAEEGVAALREALRLAPGEARLRSNLGLALCELGRFEEAETELLAAREMLPGLALVHNNLGHLYILMGRHREAIACLDRALELDGKYAAAKKNRALAYLSLGDFARGWVDYDWCAFGVELPTYEQPVWQGERLAGKHVLLTAQQGLGDTLQFVRYARRLREESARVTLEVPLPLAEVVRGVAGVDEVVVQGKRLPAADVCVPLMGLPRIFGTTLATIPGDVPYLRAEAGRVERWRERLRGMVKAGDFLVGVAWQGNPHHQWDQFRSARLGDLAGLARVRGVRLVSLQRGPGVEQIAGFGEAMVVPTDGEQRVAGDLADSAALMMLMDLVVTVDTATAHLAGALGRRVWVALAVACDWRWMTGRADSPWYPTMRLFRQRRIMEWGSVFAEMAGELEALRK